MKGERGFSDYLAYSHMAAPGVAALKNGSFLMGYRYKGPDFESATKAEVEHLAAMTNNALRRLGNGWMVHFEMIRKPADAYPTNHFTEPTNLLIDLEREAQHKLEGAHFETMNFVFFTYLPPAIEKSGVYKKIVEFVSDGETGHALSSDDQTVDYMENIVTDVIDVLGQETHM